jgi:hypothetical protein
MVSQKSRQMAGMEKNAQKSDFLRLLQEKSRMGCVNTVLTHEKTSY